MRFITFLLTILLTHTAQSFADVHRPSYGYENLANRLCTLYDRSRDLTIHSKMAVMNFIHEKEGISNPATSDAIKFLNTHKHEMTCDDKHYLNFAFERCKYNQIIYDLCYDALYDEKAKLDFNAITIVKNPETKQEEPMTVLDYIDNVALRSIGISGDPTSKLEIKEIRALLIEEFGAKHFSDLSPEEIAEWQRQTKHMSGQK
jgi:hypothetical protein